MLKPLQYWHSLDRVTPEWKELIVEAAMMSSSFITKLRGKKSDFLYERVIHYCFLLVNVQTLFGTIFAGMRKCRQSNYL